ATRLLVLRPLVPRRLAHRLPADSAARRNSPPRRALPRWSFVAARFASPSSPSVAGPLAGLYQRLPGRDRSAGVRSRASQRTLSWLRRPPVRDANADKWLSPSCRSPAGGRSHLARGPPSAPSTAPDSSADC